MADGLVTLNSDVCWIDAIAFERLLDAPRSPERIERALGLYRGNLLPGDDDERWSTVLREKLRRRFLHEVSAMEAALESSQQWQEAVDLYQRALNADSLNELFYQGLMRCYCALDRTPEAVSVYQRMQRLLSVTLGMEPAADSKAMYRRLLTVNLAWASAQPTKRVGAARKHRSVPEFRRWPARRSSRKSRCLRDKTKQPGKTGDQRRGEQRTSARVLHRAP